MRRAILPIATLLVLACTAAAFSETPQSRPINQLPMYGGAQKSAAQLEADREFFERVKKLGYTPQEGAKKSVELGWRYFGRGDMATAIQRFNQAWLLDPDNAGIYHGFALITYVRDHDVKATDQFFRRSIELGDKTVGVYVDYGRFLGETGRPAEAVKAFHKAIEIDPRHLVSHHGLVLSLARAGDMAGACDQLRESSALGLKLEPDFVSALAKANGRSCTAVPAN